MLLTATSFGSFPFITIVLVITAINIVMILLTRRRKRLAREQAILDAFAAKTIEHKDDLYWYMACDVMAKIGFDDVVIYAVDVSRNECIQQAANGPKNSGDRKIHQPIILSIGKGIVGSVALSGKLELIADTTSDPRYVPDDDVRYSEITCPIIVHGNVVAIIDSEHKSKNYFTAQHRTKIQEVARIAALKLQEL
jgi:two-component system, LytTR family, sensor kinase